MSINRCYEIAGLWTDEELRQQLDLVLDEYKHIPVHRRGVFNSSYDRVIDWYKAVCEQYRNRGKEAELNQIVAEWREQRKAKK